MLTLRFRPTGTPPVGGARANTWQDEHGQAQGTARRTAAGWRLDWPGTGCFALTRGSLVIDAWPDDGVPDAVVSATFHRILAPLVLQPLGWQAIHASGAALPGGVIAILGQSGSGKSTLAFALGQSGARQISDDSIVLRRADDGQWTVTPLPFIPRLRPASQRSFDVTQPASVVPAGPESLPLASLVLLESNPALEDFVRVRRRAPHEAFRQVLTHAHCFDEADPGETRRLTQDYLSLVEQVPVYDVVYRPSFEDLARVTEAVTALAGPR